LRLRSCLSVISVESTLPLVILSPQAKDLLPQQWVRTATFILRRLDRIRAFLVRTAVSMDGYTHEEIPSVSSGQALRLAAQDDQGGGPGLRGKRLKDNWDEFMVRGMKNRLIG
jgi:hypothetical protein